MELFGFHGTLACNVASIKRDGFKRNGSRKGLNLYGKGHRVPNDLGEGIYFFIEGYDSPDEIARKYVEYNKSQLLVRNNTSVEIIKVKVTQNDNEYLDFDERDNLQSLHKFRTRFEEIIKELIKRSDHQDGAYKRGNFDGYVVDLLVMRIEQEKKLQIKSVSRATYTKIDSEQQRSNIPNGKELCVKCSNCIQFIEDE